MGRSEWESDSARIRQRMDRLRRKIDNNVEGLVSQAHEFFDWRTQVRNHPWVCAGAAAALGFLVMPGRHVVPAVKLDDKTMEELAKQSQRVVRQPPPAKQPFLQGALAAIAGMVLRQAVGVASQRMEQYIHEVARKHKMPREAPPAAASARPLHGAN